MEDKHPPTPGDLTKLLWKPGELAQPLNAVIQAAENAVKDHYISYYQEKRSAFRQMGRWLRGVAIFLVALAGVMPLMIEVFKKVEAKQQLYVLGQFATTNTLTATPPPALAGHPPSWRDYVFDPTWSTVLLAAAAALVLYDRFYGATSGWVRFALTAQQLENALAEFRLRMQAEKLSWGVEQPSVPQAQAALGRIQQFVQQVNNIIMEETKAWAAEFAEVLRELDQRVEQAARLREKGVIELAVTNGDECQGGWKVSLNDGPEYERSGKETTLEVSPGLHRIRVSGRIGDKARTTAKAVKVGSGEIQRCELKLE